MKGNGESYMSNKFLPASLTAMLLDSHSKHVYALNLTKYTSLIWDAPDSTKVGTKNAVNIIVTDKERMIKALSKMTVGLALRSFQGRFSLLTAGKPQKAADGKRPNLLDAEMEDRIIIGN